MKYIHWVWGILFFVLLAGNVSAAGPSLLNYQGRLTDSTGKPVTGTRTMIFSFFDVQAGGTALEGFAETQNVAVQNGVFNVIIGAVTARGIPDAVFDVPAGEYLYLNVKIAGEDLVPRQRIVSVAFAKRADFSDAAQYAATAGHAYTADSATSADEATTADYAINAGHAYSADSADTADTAASSNYAILAGRAYSADEAAAADNADRLDGLDSSYFRNATNINSGYLNPSYFSAYPDLLAEGYLDNNSINDLLTRTQSDARYVQDGIGTFNCSYMNVNQNLTVAADGTGYAEIGTCDWSLNNEDLGVGGYIKCDRNLYLGGTGVAGYLYVKDSAGTSTFTVNGSTGRLDLSGDISLDATRSIFLETGTSGSWYIQGTDLGGSKELKIYGPTYGLLTMDSYGGTIRLGGDRSDSLEIPSKIVSSRDGSGADDAVLLAEHSHASGIALTGRVTSTDSCVVLVNKGTGELLKCFSGPTGGSLITEIRNNGGFRSNIIWAGTAGSSPPTVTASGMTLTASTGDLASADDTLVGDDLLVGDRAYIQGNMYVTGSKNAVVKTETYGMRKVYADESAEVNLFDRGQGKLVNGVARIELDPVFLETLTVNDEHPLLVFVTPGGPCKGIYVAETTASSFTVKELCGGKSSAAFTWEVAATRKGYEGVRLPEFGTEK